MRTTLLLLNRMLLTFGLIVALTPCGLCHGPKAAKAGHSCCSTSASKTNDCHSKSQSPLCKVMDQSSVSVPSVHLDAAVVVPVLSSVLITESFKTAPMAAVVSACVSPPRSSSVLRI